MQDCTAEMMKGLRPQSAPRLSCSCHILRKVSKSQETVCTWRLHLFKVYRQKELNTELREMRVVKLKRLCSRGNEKFGIQNGGHRRDRGRWEKTVSTRNMGQVQGPAILVSVLQSVHWAHTEPWSCWFDYQQQTQTYAYTQPIHTQVCTHIHTYTHKQIHTHMNICIHTTYTQTIMHMHTYMHTLAHVHTCTCICTHTTHVYTCAHTCTRTCILTCCDHAVGSSLSLGLGCRCNGNHNYVNLKLNKSISQTFTFSFKP